MNSCQTMVEGQCFVNGNPFTFSLPTPLWLCSFRGGLDTVNDQTGEYSYYTTHKDKEIMFHVSTLLPYNATDSQQVSLGLGLWCVSVFVCVCVCVCVLCMDMTCVDVACGCNVFGYMYSKSLVDSVKPLCGLKYMYEWKYA